MRENANLSSAKRKPGENVVCVLQPRDVSKRSVSGAGSALRMAEVQTPATVPGLQFPVRGLQKYKWERRRSSSDCVGRLERVWDRNGARAADECENTNRRPGRGRVVTKSCGPRNALASLGRRARVKCVG